MRSYLYSLIESNEIYDSSIFWGGENHQRQKSWFYKDLSMPLIKKKVRECKMCTCINVLSWKGDIHVTWKLSPESLCSGARFIGTVDKEFPEPLVFVRKCSRESLVLSLFLHTSSSRTELLPGFQQFGLGLSFRYLN